MDTIPQIIQDTLWTNFVWTGLEPKHIYNIEV